MKKLWQFTFYDEIIAACGKAFEEPILIGEARQQLFDITQSKGEDEKTRLLWSLLRN